LIRAFVLQAFYIPSESMEPTLYKNDRIMVNKLSYHLHDVRRGDLIVFRRPPNMAQTDINDLIKRVIALPNETIELRGSDIYIDDQKLTEPYLAAGTPTINLGWVTGCANPSTERTKCLVPPGHVFVMGDNRTHSSDGRVFGPIDEDLIVGRAFVRIWPPSKLGFL
jgi:signal peptidase I